MSRKFNFVTGSLVCHNCENKEFAAIIIRVNDDHVQLLTQIGLIRSNYTSYYWKIAEITHHLCYQNTEDDCCVHGLGTLT